MPLIPMRASRLYLIASAALLPAGLGLGCNALLDFGSYTVSNDSGADVNSEALSDGGTGPDADGTCTSTPTDRQQFERACTGATCQPFDNGRVPFVDGGLRPLPASTPDAAPDGPVDDGSADSGGSEGGTPDAGVAVACATLPNVVYGIGSSALQTFLGRVAGDFATTKGITFVYQVTSGSCVGVQAVLDGSFKITGTANSFDSLGNAIPCSLPPGGVTADIGVSDVFATTCQQLPNGLPQGVKENFGPVQTMTFAVPTTSQQSSISLEAAYNVFGFGDDSEVNPWIDATHIFQRNSLSGTQNMIAATIGVPAAQWQGVAHASSSTMVSDLKTAGQDPNPATADKTIGILSVDNVQANPSILRALAFQDVGQSCGYYPDSTSTALDKANVRDGHYPIWGPSHFYNFIDANGAPINANAQSFIDSLSGTNQLVGVDLLQLYAQNHLIPICAMHVTRTSDGSDYGPFTPQATCNCYFDLQATGQTSCVTCQTDSNCPASSPTCRQFGNPPTGYCEIQ
jgi:hypothetical protein